MARARCDAEAHTRALVDHAPDAFLFADHEGRYILYRPIGPGEFATIVKFGYRKFPPRTPYQPIFNPVTNEEYACDLAQSWSVNESTFGYVTRFAVREDFIAKHPTLQVDVWGHTEHWITSTSSQSR